MTTAAELIVHSNVTANTISTGSKLSPVFRIELRRRHDDAAPIERVEVRARTIASARHAARLAHPDTVILSVTRV